MAKDLSNKGQKRRKEHMNKVIAVSVVAVLSMAGFSYAADEGQEALPEKVVTKSVVTTVDALAAKKADLNNTEWAIELKPMSSAKNAKSEKDTLNFVDGKISSVNLGKSGHSPTNFTLRMLEDNETLTWETMQTSEKDGVAFWRGDIGPDGIMRGVLSKRDKKDKTSDFNFVSTGSKKVAPVAPPAPEVPAVPAAQPAADSGK